MADPMNYMPGQTTAGGTGFNIYPQVLKLAKLLQQQGAPATPDMTPQARIDQGFGALNAGQPASPSPHMTQVQPGGFSMNSQPAAMATAPVSSAPAIPMPQARPDSAPQAMGWFQRNAFLQRDPNTGEYLDPTLAARAGGTQG